MTAWRVTTWNLLGSHDPELVPIAEVLRELQPDAVALQEVRRSQARGLGRLLGWHHVWARKHHPYSPLVPWRSEGLAIVSRWPLRNRLHVSLTPHRSTWTFRHRVLLAATVVRSDGELRLYDTHLASDDADERLDQARRVADLVRTDLGRPSPGRQPLKVVAGDLNTTDDCVVEVLRELRRADLVDPGGGPTEPANAPRQRLDHVLGHVNAQVVRTHVPDGDDGWRRHSDHLPVTVDFSC